jgi:alkanesulfonate monooxygenase SsuD/methylene tetrahydromethanopterin reductase-like flavin-dependent oxidoreductase (luciferase family)
MVGINVVAASTDAEAAFLFTSLQQRFLGMRRGVRGPLPRPVVSMEGLWNEAERSGVEDMLSMSVVGGPNTLIQRLAQVMAQTGADELIGSGGIHDHGARLASYEILAGIANDLPKAAAAPSSPSRARAA